MRSRESNSEIEVPLLPRNRVSIQIEDDQQDETIIPVADEKKAEPESPENQQVIIRKSRVIFRKNTAANTMFNKMNKDFFVKALLPFLTPQDLNAFSLAASKQFYDDVRLSFPYLQEMGQFYSCLLNEKSDSYRLEDFGLSRKNLVVIFIVIVAMGALAYSASSFYNVTITDTRIDGELNEIHDQMRKIPWSDDGIARCDVLTHHSNRCDDNIEREYRSLACNTLCDELESKAATLSSSSLRNGLIAGIAVTGFISLADIIASCFLPAHSAIRNTGRFFKGLVGGAAETREKRYLNRQINTFPGASQQLDRLVVSLNAFKIDCSLTRDSTVAEVIEYFKTLFVRSEQTDEKQVENQINNRP